MKLLGSHETALLLLLVTAVRAAQPLGLQHYSK